jgi:arylsulfatase A-like enzyme
MAWAREKPNVLFLMIDDLRPELGAYGSERVQTPHMDQLASEGVVFERAYCQVPVCGASRASILTGMHPQDNRFTSFKSRADEDVPEAPTLPEVFRNAGYTTISNGKVFHNINDTAGRSWSEPPWKQEGSSRRALDPETMKERSARGRGRIWESPDVPDTAYPDGEIAEKTIADLRRFSASGEPFFLACGFHKPHLPFYAPKRYWDLYDVEDIELAGNRYFPRFAPLGDLRGSTEFWSYHHGGLSVGSDAWHRMMRHGYLACTSYVDRLVGDVLKELEQLGLAENTIVVLWGDHGFHLGEHDFWGKHNTMHLSTRVPLMLRVPGTAPGRAATFVESSDVFPTLCELAGIDIPGTVQGKSFAALLAQPASEFRNVAYSRFGKSNPGLAVITDRYSYTWYAESGAEMLFDHQTDPDENVNVAGNDEYADALQLMRDLLMDRRAEAGGPQPGVPGQ